MKWTGKFLRLLPIVILIGCAGQVPTVPPQPVPAHLESHPLLANPDYPKFIERVPSDIPSMQLIYPKLASNDSIVGATPGDSVFLFGNVTHPRGELIVAGRGVKTYPNGAWLAWVGLEPWTGRSDTMSNGEVPVGTVTLHYQPRDTSRTPYTTIVRRLVFTRLKRATTTNGDLPIAIKPQSLKLTVSQVDNGAKIRCGWPGAYDLYPVPGTELYCDGSTGSGTDMYYRVPLGAGEIGWIAAASVTSEPAASRPSPKVVHVVTSRVENREALVRIPLKRKLPFRVEQVDDDRLELTVYGAVSWTDVIRQPFGSRAVNELRWRQVDPTTYRIVAHLDPHWFWGWTVDYDDSGTLLWTIREAPELGRKKDRPLEGMTVVVDAGHGGSNIGAIGPSGLLEKNVTLPLARTTAAALESAGATVILSRDGDTNLSLVARTQLAVAQKADVLLSLHYNGLPQGESPWLHHGTSVHYVHRLALPLARSLYEMIQYAVGWDGDGLRYQDLSLPRLTWCPSVLIENGFLMHPQEECLAQDEMFQQTVANAIRDGLIQFVQNRFQPFP